MSTGTIGGISPPGSADPRVTALPGRPRRWRAVAGWSLSLIIGAAAIAALALGAHYQPVGVGNSPGNLVGHLITRQVGDFGPVGGETYLPPQSPHSGGLYVSLTNNGPLAVTIESASLNGPYQGPVDRQAQPLRDYGTPTYWPAYGSQSGPGRPLAGLILQPGQQILLRLPVRTAGCWMPAHGWTELFSFWVTVRFLAWTHQSQVWWTSPSDQSQGAIVAHESEPASQGGHCPR